MPLSGAAELSPLSGLGEYFEVRCVRSTVLVSLGLAAVFVNPVLGEEEQSGVGLSELVLIADAYLLDVEVKSCRELAEFKVERLGDVELSWLDRLANGVLSRSLAVVLSGEVSRRAKVRQAELGGYMFEMAEGLGSEQTWLVPTDPDRGGPCESLASSRRLQLLSTKSWCDVTPSRDASCFFELDYAYKPSSGILQAFREFLEAPPNNKLQQTGGKPPAAE